MCEEVDQLERVKGDGLRVREYYLRSVVGMGVECYSESVLVRVIASVRVGCLYSTHGL